MKIYFGRKPDLYHTNLDFWFIDILTSNNYNFEISVDKMVEILIDIDSYQKNLYHTINPLIVNYFTDEFAKEYLYIIDENGIEIKLGDDEYMLKKLSCLSPGEVVCDDFRSFL